MLRRLTLLQDRLDQEQREKVEFQKEVSGILEGNRRLKEEVKFLEDRGRETSPFATPDGKQESKPKEAERPPKEAAGLKEAANTRRLRDPRRRLQVQRRLQIQRRLRDPQRRLQIVRRLIDPQRKVKCCPRILQSKSFSSLWRGCRKKLVRNGGDEGALQQIFPAWPIGLLTRHPLTTTIGCFA